MKVKSIFAISLFVIASSTTSIALSCGESSCGDEGGGSACSCSDPGAQNLSSCTGGAARYCELFGNIGKESTVPDYSNNDEIVTQGVSYEDYRGTDDQFNRRTYNIDNPRPRYKD